MQLLRARELLMQRFRPHLHAHGLTEQQWRVIRALSEVSSMTNQQLSDHCVLHPASMSRILPNLEKDGLITRAPTEHDRRLLEVRLTEQGRALFEEVVPENDEEFAAIVEELGEDVIDDAYVALDVLIEMLSQGNERPIMAPPQDARRRGRMASDDASRLD
jgi:homoprotocatechuate degradation regulator HpaR